MTQPAHQVTPTRTPRAVPVRSAIRWFIEAMRLWKRGPATFALLAFVVLLVNILAEPIPVAGFVVANIAAPLLATGFLFASLAADRGDRPRVRHLIAVFAAPLRAQIAVVTGALMVFIAEAYAAWQFAGVNLFLPLPTAAALSTRAILAIYAAGIAASLPVTFVPFIAVFDGEGIWRSFALSARAFVLNVWPLAFFAACSFMLLMAGLATMGVGLVLVLPWIAAASYAAWKDVFGLAESTSARSA